MILERDKFFLSQIHREWGYLKRTTTSYRACIKPYKHWATCSMRFRFVTLLDKSSSKSRIVFNASR